MKLNPVYAPPGYDPTREEFPLARPGCGGCILMLLIIVALATDGFAFMLNKRPAQAQSSLPTLASMPGSDTAQPTGVAHRVTETSATPKASAIITATTGPTNTLDLTHTSTPTPSPSPTRTSTRRPTLRPTARRVVRSSGTGGQGERSGPAVPVHVPPPLGGQPMRAITVWAPPIAATCCKPLEPLFTWTPTNTAIALTATASPTASLLTMTIQPIVTATPTASATPIWTASPSPTATQIPPTATLSPTDTAIPPSETSSPIAASPTETPTQIAATATPLPSNTTVPPTETSIPTETASLVPSTATQVPSNTPIPLTATLREGK